jgi:hypothetical protein
MMRVRGPLGLVMMMVPVGVLLIAAALGTEPTPAPPAPPSSSAPGREAQLRERLSGARLAGSWRMTTTGEGAAAPLSEPREEVYTIGEVTHLGGEQWMITARIRYADRDATIPVPVRIVWAGDTPVITLDNLELPLLGRYTARVMVYGDFYSGVWFGAGYGGVMAGRVIPAGAAEASATPAPSPSASPAPSD